jgi:hypothetical protein
MSKKQKGRKLKVPADKLADLLANLIFESYLLTKQQNKKRTCPTKSITFY